jgi:CubicO group peptidase (beta-lactamase class C family)
MCRRLHANVHRSTAIAISAMAVACSSPDPKQPERLQSASPINANDLTAFVDSFVTARMTDERIPGAGFVFVQNDRVLLSRGYGLADVARQHRVVPDSTIWRIGSISKIFTATAVMQLVDRGEVQLDAPVETYLRRVAIPHTYPDPVTVRHLLDHTAGFDEIRPGTQAATQDSVLPLDRFLDGRLVRIRRRVAPSPIQRTESRLPGRWWKKCPTLRSRPSSDATFGSRLG